MKYEVYQSDLSSRESYQSLLELRQLADIENMTVRKEKLQLPKEASSNKGRFVCYLNTTKEDIATVINNKHPLLLNQGSTYKGYYYEHIPLRTSIKSTRIKNPGKSLKELKLERVQDYGEMQRYSEIINTPVNIKALAGKNFIYDLEPVTRLLKLQSKLKKLSLLQRFRIYFDTIGIFYDNLQFSGYTKGPIFINLDGIDLSNTTLNDWVFFDYMMLLLKKSDNVIAKVLSSSKPMEVLFYTNKGYLLIDTGKDLKRENYSKVKNLVKRLKPSIGNFDGKLETIIKKDFEHQVVQKMNLTGTIVDDDSEENTILGDTVSKKVKVVKDKESDVSSTDIETDSEDAAIDDTIEDLNEDENLKMEYIKSVTEKKVGTKSQASLKRDQLLREKQMKLKIHDKTIEELVKDIPNPPSIETYKIDTDVTDNEELKNIKFYNFESTYNKELFDRDMARAITSFNDKGINVNVTNIEIKDTSTEMIYQDTYTIEFEDENRKRHKMSINIPKLVDDKFLIINGKKKVIQKQLFGLPVIKTASDTVQIVTNYNKLWITRHGTRFNPNMERFKKMAVDPERNKSGVTITATKGDNTIPNEPYATCLEYDELAKLFTKIKIKDCTFIFSMVILKEELGDKFKEPTLEEIIIGYKGKNKEPIVYNTKGNNHTDLVSLIIETSMPDYYPEFKKLSSGRKYVHNNVKIMEKVVPMVFIVCFFEGLTTVIQKFNQLAGSAQIEFVDKKDNSDNCMYIKFADGYVKYPMNDLEACLLFNGFTELDLKDYTIADMDDRGSYLDIFEALLGSSYYAGGFINYYDFMIDFKTLDILKMLNYPEDIVSLMIYASNLLADGSFSIDTDPRLYRLRDNEIIPAIVYKEMTKSYARYRKTANNANPKKLTVDPNCVIKTLSGLPTVASYSTLSPIVEVKEFGVASMKGLFGMNKDRSYNEAKRNYHDNMVGIIGISTDIAGNCGKERHLVVEPNVVNAYGMLDIKGLEGAKDMDATKLMTTEEMTYPMGVAHDDPNRTAMTSKQACHAIPVKDQCPCLITNGFDSTIQYRTSNDFSYVAKQDGEVIDRDDNTNIMVIKYKDGTVQAIDLDSKIVQNGGGGMYFKNKLDSSYKKGDKFKKDAILAFDKKFYKDTGVMGNKLTYGTLVKSACLSNFATYEDSMWSTYRISRNMSADITMKEVSVVLGKNSNVDFVVKEGDQVVNGQDLIRFDTSYNEAEMNELLNNIRTDLQEDIINIGKSKFTTKHDGVVAAVKVFPAIPPSEMSPSLRKFVNQTQSHEKKRREFMNKYDKNKDSVYRKGIYFTSSAGVIEPDQFGKIGGDDVGEGVKVEIYVTYHDEVSDGDKFTHMSANKATNGYMIPRGLEPYSEFRPFEEIDIPLAPSAILQRGTPSIITIFLAYKVLIELKRSCFEILTGINWNEKQRKERPYMDVHGKPNTLNNLNGISESSIGGFDTSKLESAVEKLEMLFDVFDLAVTEDGSISCNREYSKGDIVLSGLDFHNEVNRAAFESLLSTNKEYLPNLSLDESLNAYVANDFIYYGERLVI